MGDWKWIALAIATFTVAVSAVGFWKYAHFRYQGLDLAIYTNVLWNLAHGNGWWSSIQANAYLGDHVEPILLLIAPLFRMWPDARLLIVLQALALGLTAIPVYLLLLSRSAERAGYEPASGWRWTGAPRPGGDASSTDGGGQRQALRALLCASGRTREQWAWICTALWLCNPLLWNAALFEFHALAFAPVLLLSAAVAYLRWRLVGFAVFAIAALLVREDIAFTVAMFGVVAAIDWWQYRKQIAAIRVHASSERVALDGGSPAGLRRLEHGRGWPATGPASASRDAPRQALRALLWIIVPIVLGVAWTLIASRIAMSANLAGSYKFLVYYGWLRAAGSLDIVRHLLSFGNFEMILGLLLPFAFLPLVRPKWLLLALPSSLALMLAVPGGSAIVVMTHYALAFIPALVLASADAIAAWRTAPHLAVRAWLARQLPQFPVRLAMPIAAAWVIATAWLLGPLSGIARILVYGATADDAARATAYRELLARVPADAPIAASYAALPHVAARRSAYSMASAYLGVTQFAEAPYVLPAETAYLLMDTRDALAYAVQFPTIGWSAPYAAGGVDRFRAIIRDRRFALIAERDGVALLQRNGVASAPLGDQYARPLAVPLRAYLGIDDLRDVTVQHSARSP